MFALGRFYRDFEKEKEMDNNKRRTLVDLHDILWNCFDKLQEEGTEYQRKKNLTNVEYSLGIAKQMINNADIILRRDVAIKDMSTSNAITGKIED